jgi:hypothetical protein
MAAATRAPALHITSQILGESPKRSHRQDSTGRMAKIRLPRQASGKMRRNHGCNRAPQAASLRRAALTIAMVTEKFTATAIVAKRSPKNRPRRQI